MTFGLRNEIYPHLYGINRYSRALRICLAGSLTLLLLPATDGSAKPKSCFFTGYIIATNSNIELAAFFNKETLLLSPMV